MDTDDERDLENVHLDAIASVTKFVGKNYRLSLTLIKAIFRVFLETIQILQISHLDLLEIGEFLKIRATLSDGANKNLSSILSKHYKVTPALLRQNDIYKHPIHYQYVVENEKKVLKSMIDNDEASFLIFLIFSSQ